MKANNWLYHYYMVQSRLQYNLAYGGQPSTIAALYPQMMHMITPPFAHGFPGDPSACGAMPMSAHDQYTPNGGSYAASDAAAAYNFNSFARYHESIKEKEFRNSYYSNHLHHQRSPPPDSRSESSSPVANNGKYYPYDVTPTAEDYSYLNHGARRGYHNLREEPNLKSSQSPGEFANGGSDPEDDNNNCENKSPTTAPRPNNSSKKSAA